MLLALMIVYWSFLAFGCGYAMRHGGRPERTSALVMIAGSILSVALTSGAATKFQEAELGILAVDLAMLATFLLLALRNDRLWLLWATGFHLVGVATHTAMIVNPDLVPRAYSLAQGFWAYPVIASLMAGTASHRRQTRRATAAIS